MNNNEAPAKLGTWILTALVAGNMIGSGIFLLPSALGYFGSIGILGWVFTSAGALLLALVFAKMSSIIPRVGGPYAYCYAGFGEFVGFVVAYNYWVALWIGNAGIVTAFIGYLAVFFPALVTDHVLGFGVSLAIVWSITLVNVLGIRHAGILQLITTGLKLLPLLAIAVCGLFYFHPSYLSDFNVSGKPFFPALTSVAALTMWSFVGLESATVPAEAALDPKRTIPRATVLGVIIAAFVYIFSTVAVMGVMNIQALQQSTAPYADAAKLIFGSWAYWVVGAGAVIACFGALNGWTLLQGQIPYAAARDNLFPRSFAKQSRWGTPVVGLVGSSVCISLLLLLTLDKDLIEQFTIIILLATFASLIPYFLTAMAELMLFIRRREEFNLTRLTGSSVIAVLAGAYAFWALSGAGKETVYYGTLLLLSSIPVYVWMKWRA